MVITSMFFKGKEVKHYCLHWLLKKVDPDRKSLVFRLDFDFGHPKI